MIRLEIALQVHRENFLIRSRYYLTDMVYILEGNGLYLTPNTNITDDY